MISDTSPAPLRRRQVNLAGVILLATGFAAMCLALFMLVGGSLLADYYDARYLTWRLPAPLEEYPLLGIPGSFIGLFLLTISGPIGSRRVKVLMALTGLVFIPLFICILAGARPVYPTTRCSLNQMRLILVITMYTQDHDRLPTQLPDIYPYLGDEDRADLLACPLSRHAFHPQLGYGLNGNLAGKSLDDIQEPDGLLLTADSVRPSMRISTIRDIDTIRHVTLKMVSAGGESDFLEDPSHTRGYVAGFVDGSARFIDAGKNIRMK